MDTVKGILLLSTVVLAGIAFFLFLSNTSKGAQLDDARAMSDATLKLLQLQGGKCSATAGQYATITSCIMPQLMAKDFKEDSFGQPKNGEPGYLVIKNVNKRTYASANFTFEKNRVLTQEGCHIAGDIGYNVACRFAFPDACKDGDVLEVMYGGVKVFTKTC
jgi:hypothetical protein